jgi:glyoxylase-like metal-dependent hydrolase (beta-lactamase superfamily II)
MSATVEILTTGYAHDRVASTITAIFDEDKVLVVDPGMVADRRTMILEPLRRLGVSASDVSDVVFSHHHPDHTLNAALFENARFHDYWAIYRNDEWLSRDAEGYTISTSVHLIATPGHTRQDISTVVMTAEGRVVLTHAWWEALGPSDDPLAEDAAQLKASRRRILELSPTLIIPGHGAGFAPDATTPV